MINQFKAMTLLSVIEVGVEREVLVAHLNLGIAYEELNNVEKAIYYYQEFVDLWKEADEDLPDLLEAKSRLEQLHSLAI